MRWSPRALVALLALSPLAAQADVLAYSMHVEVRARALVVSCGIDVIGKLPTKWLLELVPEMVVVSVLADGKAVPFTFSARQLVIEPAAALACAEGERQIMVVCEGAPSERFSKARGGFVRSAVGPEMVYVRSQVPWYPRIADDPARYRVTVDAPRDWQVRSAGCFAAPDVRDDRSYWSFATPIPVDRIGLAAGPWQLVSADKMDALVTPGHEPAARELLTLARRALGFHGKELGGLGKRRFALIEMPASFGRGSGYSECGYLLLGSGAFSATPMAPWVPGFLAHETAHQWWGHRGLFSDFANEALAEYAALRYLRATAGKAAVRRTEVAAVARLRRAVAADKTVALGDIKGWGGGLDPETYRVHAYDKGMLMLAEIEAVVGRRHMQKCLREVLVTAVSGRVGWSDLRAQLCALGAAATATVEAWERPGLPASVAPIVAEIEARQASLTDSMRIANNPGEADRRVLEQGIAALQVACDAAGLSAGEQAAAHTGLGRCLFRLGQHEAAVATLRTALELGAGGPFHRGWAELRLGNLADLDGEREAALAHYQHVLDNRGASKATVQRAREFVQRRYRSYAEDR